MNESPLDLSEGIDRLETILADEGYGKTYKAIVSGRLRQMRQGTGFTGNPGHVSNAEIAEYENQRKAR